jgi:hypothetical protein
MVRRHRCCWRCGGAPVAVMVVGFANGPGITGTPHGDVNVLKNFTGRNTLRAIAGEDQIVAFLPGVLASDSVDEGEGGIELPGPHKKARAVSCPLTNSTFHSAVSFGGRKELRLEIG